MVNRPKIGLHQFFVQYYGLFLKDNIKMFNISMQQELKTLQIPVESRIYHSLREFRKNASQISQVSISADFDPSLLYILYDSFVSKHQMLKHVINVWCQNNVTRLETIVVFMHLMVLADKVLIQQYSHQFVVRFIYLLRPYHTYELCSIFHSTKHYGPPILPDHALLP